MKRVSMILIYMCCFGGLLYAGFNHNSNGRYFDGSTAMYQFGLYSDGRQHSVFCVDRALGKNWNLMFSVYDATYLWSADVRRRSFLPLGVAFIPSNSTHHSAQLYASTHYFGPHDTRFSEVGLNLILSSILLESTSGVGIPVKFTAGYRYFHADEHQKSNGFFGGASLGWGGFGFSESNSLKRKIRAKNNKWLEKHNTLGNWFEYVKIYRGAPDSEVRPLFLDVMRNASFSEFIVFASAHHSVLTVLDVNDILSFFPDIHTEQWKTGLEACPDLVFRIPDQDLLIDIFVISTNSQVRMNIVKVLDQPSVYRLIADSALQEYEKLAFMINNKTIDWVSAIETNPLHIVLQASEFSRSKFSRNHMREAALLIIASGDESRIDDLKSILGDYGDKNLALEYLNCGHPDLEAAARSWGTANNYKVIDTPRAASNSRWGRH